MRRYRSWIRTFSVLLAGIALTGLGWGWLRADNVAPALGAEQAQLEVSLGERELRVIEGGEVTATYPVAIGTSDHPTPRGTFNIRRIVWNPSWTPPDEEWARDKEPTPPGDPKNPMGRAKIFFASPDYYIHGTNDEGSLGRAASHGCLRMSNDDVIALARLVMENGGETRPANWFRRILNSFTDTEEVRLSTPVTIVIRA